MLALTKTSCRLSEILTKGNEMDKRKLFEMASSFRKAIIDAIDSGSLHEVNLLCFPDGCCTYASDLLQRYLFENSIVTTQMSGTYGNGWTGESHAWLETLDGIVIDITGDQYKNKSLKFTIPVYVGTRFDGFHDRFVLNEPYEYDADRQDQSFENRYNIVLNHLRNYL